MSARRTLLTLLPKVALSRATGLLTRLPVPRGLRRPFYGWFARRYGCVLEEAQGEPTDYRSLAAFFARPLRAGARPIADAPLVWPCDGRIVTSGAIDDGRIPQVKGVDYALADLFGNAELAARVTASPGASQVTIYLAPGDYHRVHAPFAATVTSIHRLAGTLFPVNPPAVRAIPELFVRNARTVFACELADGRVGAVVMVGALNVGDVRPSVTAGAALPCGGEVGAFGFGSTAVVVLEGGGPAFATVAPETVVRQGAGAPLA